MVGNTGYGLALVKSKKVTSHLKQTLAWMKNKSGHDVRGSPQSDILISWYQIRKHKSSSKSSNASMQFSTLYILYFFLKYLSDKWLILDFLRHFLLKCLEILHSNTKINTLVSLLFKVKRERKKCHVMSSHGIT